VLKNEEEEEDFSQLKRINKGVFFFLLSKAIYNTLVLHMRLKFVVKFINARTVIRLGISRQMN